MGGLNKKWCDVCGKQDVEVAEVAANVEWLGLVLLSRRENGRITRGTELCEECARKLGESLRATLPGLVSGLLAPLRKPLPTSFKVEKTEPPGNQP